LPASIDDEYILDAGNWNGSAVYWSLHCGSREDCLKAFEVLSGRDRKELEPWSPSRFAVVMLGPRFYRRGAPLPHDSESKKYTESPWSVGGIVNGVVHESVDVGSNPRFPSRMNYYAIDFDANRVYHHYESGGFPADPWP
jgi:hypothetical protein